jgi:hypothetical protein
LLSIGPLGGKAQEALRAAYAAYRHAAEMAPPLDRGLASDAGGLAKQYSEAREAAMVREELREHRHDDAEYAARLARVNEAVADLGHAMEEARQTADLADSRWRRAVVQHLLLPIEEVSAECFECLIFRDLPPGRRAEALHQAQALRAYEDSDEGKAHWDLICEQQGVEKELRRWQLMQPQSVTEAVLHDAKLKELNTRLADLNSRIDDIGRSGGSKQPPIDVAQESAPERQQRRLADLRAFGGDWVKRSAGWRSRDQQSGAFKRLVEQERNNGSPKCSEKSVRRDLCAAAEAEAESKRSGIMFGGLAAP